MIEDALKFIELLLTLILGAAAFAILASRCAKKDDPVKHDKKEANND